MKWQDNKTVNWRNGKLTKWQVDQMLQRLPFTADAIQFNHFSLSQIRFRKKRTIFSPSKIHLHLRASQLQCCHQKRQKRTNSCGLYCKHVTIVNDDSVSDVPNCDVTYKRNWWHYLRQRQFFTAVLYTAKHS